MSISKLKKLWSSLVVSKNITGLLKLYENNFIFKGTFSNVSTKDKKDLEKYFVKFSEDIDRVEFLKQNNNQITNKNLIIDTGLYNFYTSECKIQAQYQFVFQKKR